MIMRKGLPLLDAQLTLCFARINEAKQKQGHSSTPSAKPQSRLIANPLALRLITSRDNISQPKKKTDRQEQQAVDKSASSSLVIMRDVGCHEHVGGVVRDVDANDGPDHRRQNVCPVRAPLVDQGDHEDADDVTHARDYEQEPSWNEVEGEAAHRWEDDAACYHGNESESGLDGAVAHHVCETDGKECQHMQLSCHRVSTRTIDLLEAGIVHEDAESTIGEDQRRDQGLHVLWYEKPRWKQRLRRDPALHVDESSKQ